jgi:glycosyltransferase involved in cell wall biosynthesis
VRSAVYFLDDVLEDDLPMLYNLADLCVMPSHYEGFGFPVLEAMACGTPVICARASSLPEIAGDAALLFDPNDAQSLAQTVVRCLTEPEQYQRMQASGTARAATFTWEQTTHQTLSQYTTMLASP